MKRVKWIPAFVAMVLLVASAAFAQDVKTARSIAALSQMVGELQNLAFGEVLH